MCGITGILNRNGEPVSPVLLQRMMDAIRHRGPDGEGCFTDRFVGLGHRRLAILDLSPAAHQPMATEDGAYVISYNGELYNFQELKTELEALGHQFRSRSDTEVVLHALAQWGEQALLRFNGMFALALWDTRRQELLLARDRFGVKPLYFTQQDSVFLFSSEIKSFIAHPAFKANIDCGGLLEYLTFQNFFTASTLFKGVRLLPPGCFMRVSPGEASPQPTRYWDYNFKEPDNPLSAEEYSEELDRLFIQAVSRQLISDVPISSYLSGGMDSGSITALAAQKMPYIKTFTVGFDLNSASGIELGFDERAKAEHMSYLFKTEHYEMVLKAGDMERVLPRLVWHLEEPRVGQSYPNFYASQLASKFSKVVLSGAGGDELFGGYPWRYYRAVVNSDFENYIEKYYSFWQRLMPEALIREAIRPCGDDMSTISTRDIMRDTFGNHASELTRPEDYINHSLYFEAKTFLHGLLVVEDKLSMAHGLETRVPFLDNDLVDFAMRVPTRLKLGNLGEVARINENEPGKKTAKYFEQNRDGKLILRKAMERYIPPSVTQRIKQGFSAPDASWFRGESIDYVRSLLYDPQARIWNYLERRPVQAILDQHLEGLENHRLLIWSLLYLETWFQVFMPARASYDAR